jgi:hypothetical protein
MLHLEDSDLQAMQVKFSASTNFQPKGVWESRFPINQHTGG